MSYVLNRSLLACSVWKCFRNFRISNLPLGEQGLAQLLFHVINAEILKVFRTSANHQKSYTLLLHHNFLNVDTVVMTFVRIWIHFDVETDLEAKEPTFLWHATQTAPSCGPDNHQALKPAAAHENSCYRQWPGKELTRAIWVLFSSQGAGKTGKGFLMSISAATLLQVARL